MGMVCANRECVYGNCCLDADCSPVVECGGSLSCNNHWCEGCNVGEDCYPEYPCLDPSGACLPDHTCKPVDQLAVKDGFCFILGICMDRGTNYGDNCRICYDKEAEGGHKKDWTPGLWSPSQGWQRQKCYIDGVCYNIGTVNPEMSEQSNECQWCEPQLGLRQTLFNWSPIEDGGVEFGDRVICHDPLFTVPDPVVPGQTVESSMPAYSGTLDTGYCWQGVCRGLAWTPWLPLGMSGAGHVGNVTVNAEACKFVGAFGGGFGAGIPHPNPGCHDESCP